MTSKDYTSTGGGLKLKGGISKPTKKKRSKKPTSALSQAAQATEDTDAAVESADDALAEKDIENDIEDDRDATDTVTRAEHVKTETELRSEEMRRKRVCERLSRHCRYMRDHAQSRENTSVSSLTYLTTARRAPTKRRRDYTQRTCRGAQYISLEAQ